MKFVYGIWPFSSQVWNFKKPKITICKVGLLESVSNGGEKLSEPWQFKKLKHLIGAKELFHVKLKNSVKSQCGNLMILHSISHVSCEITFINAKSFHAFVHLNSQKCFVKMHEMTQICLSVIVQLVQNCIFGQFSPPKKTQKPHFCQFLMLQTCINGQIAAL